MGRGDLTNEEWHRLEPHLPLYGRRGGRWASHRRVINGILFRERTGIPMAGSPDEQDSPRQRRWWQTSRAAGGPPGQWGDAPQMIPVLERVRVARKGEGRPRTRPGHLSADKAYSSRRNRRYLRRRHIKHTDPEPKDQRANRQRRGSRGGRPAGFDKEKYKRRNEVERTINHLKSFRAVATRFDKRAYVFHGTVTVAAIRLWLQA
ncbi:transposase [Streptomyces sp. NPDC127063]|uniref:transposase n=1 Tax=Streptomyces sp. NPDC127063 TaxID=3347123 RepID=UPI003663219A